MKRLFIELYLDEDVGVLVADLMRSHGFDAVTAREAGQLGKGDGLAGLGNCLQNDQPAIQALNWGCLLTGAVLPHT